MEKPFELAYTELKKGCFPEELSFCTTAELEPLEGVIGQERAVKAFDFGLAVKMKGYNIYMAGGLPARVKPPMQETAPKSWRRQSRCRMIGAMSITFRTPEALWRCASSRDRASSSRRTWQSWYSFSKQSCRRRSVRRITKHRKTLWSIPLMKKEMRLWQK